MAEKTEAVNKKALEDVKKELALQLSQVIHKVRSYVKSLQPDEGTLWKALQRFCSAKGVHDSYDCNRHYTNCLDLTYLTYNVTLPEADCCMACATKQPAGSSFITANFQRTVAGRGLELYLDFNDNPRFYGQAPDAPFASFDTHHVKLYGLLCSGCRDRMRTMQRQNRIVRDYTTTCWFCVAP